MKNLFFVAIFFSLLTFQKSLAVNIQWRFSNPRIIFTGTSGDKQCLEYEVQVKGDSPGSRIWAISVISTINNNVSYQTFQRSLTFLTASKYNFNVIQTSGYLNMYITSIYSMYSSNPTEFDMMPTDWTSICMVRVEINSKVGTPGITFYQSEMNFPGMQGEKLFAAPWTDDYQSSYDPKDLSNLFLGRIFSSKYGWSQYGGSSHGVQYIDWNSEENTSVWDTSTEAAFITETNSLSAYFRIHEGARLCVLPGKDLTCTGPTQILEPRGLVIGSETGMAQFLDNGTITYGSGGSARVFVKFTQDKWHLYSIPVVSTNARPYYNMYMKYYREPENDWKYVRNAGFTPDTILNTPMQGYYMWAASSGEYTNPGCAAPTGELFNGDVTSYDLKRSAIAGSYPFNGWNLIGNPYPCAIDLSPGSGISWNDIEANKAWFFDGNQYTVYIPEGGTHSQYAPAQQGFFVHHAETTTDITNITIPHSARTIGTEAFSKQTEKRKDLLYLTLKNESGFEDIISVSFRTESTPGYDELYDADKMWGNEQAPQLYSILQENRYLTVNSMPWQGNAIVVPLGFYSPPGDLTFTASNISSFGSKHIYLEDSNPGEWYDLTKDSVFSFNHFNNDFPARFTLHFLKDPIGIAERTSNKTDVYSYKSFVYVLHEGSQPQGLIEIFDMTGRKVFGSKFSGNHNKFDPELADGYYAVRVNTPFDNISKKICISR